MAIQRSALTERSQNSIILLSILYAAISISVQGLSVTPNFGTSEFRLGIFVPASAAIIFGQTVGGITAALGNMIIDMYHILEDPSNNSAFQLTNVFGAAANFTGAYIAGWLAVERKVNETGMIELILSPSNWYKIFLNSIAAVIGLSIVTGALLGYGVIWLYLIEYKDVPINDAVGYEFDGTGFEAGTASFQFIMTSNALVLLVLMPLTLFLYDLSYVLKLKKNKRIDEEYQQLEVDYSEMNAVKIQKIELSEHAMWKGHWNPIIVEFSNNLKQASAFRIEAVSSGKIFPQLDKSSILQPGESFHQTFYVLPGEQDVVNLRLMMTPRIKQSFKQKYENVTIAEVSARTINRDRTGGLFEFSGINIVVFILSILWSNILKIIEVGIESILDNLTLVGIFLALEIILFIPFLIFQYRDLKRLKQELEEGSIKLSLPTDQTSHVYGDTLSTKGEIAKEVSRFSANFVNLILSFILLISLGILIGDLSLIVLRGEAGFLDDIVGSSMADYHLYLSSGIILLALIRFKVVNAVFGIHDLEEYAVLETQNVLLRFEPKEAFRVNHPNEILVEVVNPTDQRGIRIKFQGLDSTSPSIIELHLEPKETVSFKISLTPVESGEREMIAIVFPLFDEEGNYIDQEVAEPLLYQKISFSAVTVTLLGLTEDQLEILKKLIVGSTLITGALISFNQFIQIDDLFIRLRDSLPIIALFQLPLIYIYFYFNNRFKRRLFLL